MTLKNVTIYEYMTAFHRYVRGFFENRCPAVANEVVCKGKVQGKGVPVHCHGGTSGTDTAAHVV